MIAIIDYGVGNLFSLCFSLRRIGAEAVVTAEPGVIRSAHKLTDDEHRKAWLIRCTLNRANSLFASPFRRRTVPLEEAARIGVEDDCREVYSAVLSLPAKYRAVIHLHYFEGLSVTELAAALGSTEGTVKSQLHRGRTLLRDMLKEVEL